MKKFGAGLLLVILSVLSGALMFERITVVNFTALGLLWIVACLVLIFGPETITEITLWKASIKRDVSAAKEIRDEVERTRDDLRGMVKLIVEDAYILASVSMLAMGADKPARDRLERNMEKLCEFAEPMKEKEAAWWGDVEAVFAHRKSSPTKHVVLTVEAPNET